jgi:cupin superfamily acireductone dioxygenase involved in methionine salvage
MEGYGVVDCAAEKVYNIYIISNDETEQMVNSFRENIRRLTEELKLKDQDAVVMRGDVCKLTEVRKKDREVVAHEGDGTLCVDRVIPFSTHFQINRNLKVKKDGIDRWDFLFIDKVIQKYRMHSFKRSGINNYHI